MLLPGLQPAQADKITPRPSSRFIIGPCTTVVTSKTPFSSTPSGGWATRHLPATTRMLFSHSMLDPGIAWEGSKCLVLHCLNGGLCLTELSLAYIEMRIILSRVLWNFDMRIAEESVDWMSKQRIYNLWEKGPLMVYLTPAR